MTFGPFSVLYPLPHDYEEPEEQDPDYARDIRLDDWDE